MKTVWNQRRMIELLNDFYKIFHIRVGFFSPEGEELLAYPQNVSPYCNAVRNTDTGYERCMKCDRKAYSYVSAHRELHIYRCHAGLTEMIVPIQGRGAILGYLMMGQFRSGKETDVEQKQRNDYLTGLGITSAELITSLYEQLPALEDEYIRACAHLLQACAVYVWMDDYLQIQEAPLGRQVENYIMNHLNEKITLSTLMRAFGIGKTTLCSTLKSEMGITVSELIRNIRIEEARHLLRDSAITIAEVACRVGIEDYNYFTRVFKHETGYTPSAYRKKYALNSNDLPQEKYHDTHC